MSDYKSAYSDISNHYISKVVPENDVDKERYKTKCDKVAGYLRIYDKKEKSFCRLDGTISKNNDETHFKIKRREEM